VQEETFTTRAIAASGWKRSRIPGYAGEPNISTHHRQTKTDPLSGSDSLGLAGGLDPNPHRFRTKRQLWAYSGLALETRISAEYCYVQGQLRRSEKLISIRGLNKDHNHDLKGLFKAAAIMASARPGPLHDFYQSALAKGIQPPMAPLTLARKITAITLTVSRKGEDFDPEKLKLQAA
jgi:hypothetical protein